MLTRFRLLVALACAATVFSAVPVRADAPGTIVEIASGAPNFKTLVAAVKAAGLVDTLNEVSEMSYRHTDADVLRLYEIWLKTGSRRAHRLLQGLGVQPVAQAGNRREH